MKKPIDLSLDNSLFSSKIVDRALYAYRTMVEKRMSNPDTMKTPYGTWVVCDDGSYAMLSTLDNRYVDTELSYPFLPVEQKDETFERVHNGKGVTVMESLQSRKEMRCRARRTLFQFMTNQSLDSSNYEDPIVYVPVVDNASSQRVYNRTKKCITGKLVRCVNSSWESGNFLIDKDLHDEVYAQRCAQGPAVSAGNVVVPVLLDQVIAANLKHYKRTQNGVTPGERYKCFINQKTLAMLEANHVNTEHLWSRFAVQGLLTGLPLVVRTTPKQLCETNLLSPSSSGSGYDVATSIFYAMWSLGCADDFLINLDLVNPNNSKRGLYMEFNLGGKRGELVDMTWRSPEDRDYVTMLSRPDKEIEVIVDDLDDILSIFEKAIKEGMEVAR